FAAGLAVSVDGAAVWVVAAPALVSVVVAPPWACASGAAIRPSDRAARAERDLMRDISHLLMRAPIGTPPGPRCGRRGGGHGPTPVATKLRRGTGRTPRRNPGGSR